MGERVIPEETALAIVRVWLTTAFEGGRHAQRIAQLEPQFTASDPRR
jgi:ribose 5-phosphate isomerase B